MGRIPESNSVPVHSAGSGAAAAVAVGRIGLASKAAVEPGSAVFRGIFFGTGFFCGGFCGGILPVLSVQLI